MSARVAAPRRRLDLLGACAGLLAACVLVGACTSSDGGGPNPGGGQSPDPVVLDFPIAYVKRPLTASTVLAPDARELLAFERGSDLYVRDRASPSSAEVNVTGAITQGAGDVRDVEPSYDGTKLVFAMRGPLPVGADLLDPPTWNIWEYDLTTRTLRRVIASDIVADEGHDVAPHYLPDGRIVFSSTRQRQSKAILLDEGKPQFAALDENRDEPAFVLHVMNADGSDIHQISFNQSHDLDPAVLDDGRIVFSRWDNASGHDELSLYTMRPDGTDLALYYGARSHDTGTDDSTIQFLDARPMASGKLLVRAQPFEAPDLGGQLLEIETTNYIENTQPTAPNRGVLAGPAQVAATINDVRTIEGPSPGGRYSSAYPLRDGTNRLLVTWSQCRLLEGTSIVPCTEARLATGTAVAAPPLYGLWIYDPARRTQLPVDEPRRRHDTDGRGRVAAAAAATCAARPGRRRRLRRRTGERGRRCGRHPQRVRHCGHRQGTRRHSGAARSGADACGRAACAFRAHREAGQHAGRRRARLRRQRVRRDVRVRHARDPRLRAGRARWVRAHQGAGGRGLRDQRARRRRTPHRATARQLAAGARRPGAAAATAATTLRATIRTAGRTPSPPPMPVRPGPACRS